MLIKITNVSKTFTIGNFKKKINENRISANILTMFARKFKSSALDEYAKENDMNICPFCGRYSKYKSIINYDKINNSATITFLPNTNKDGLINYACLKKGCNHNLNPNSIEFISKAYHISEKDALKYIHDRNHSPFYIENHESYEDYLDYQRRDLNFFINRYGEEEGKKKYDKMRSNCSLKSTSAYIKEHRGLEYYLELKKKKATCCLSHFIEKYGEEEGKKKYDEHIKKVIQTEENMIFRYGEEEGKKRWIKYINTLKYISSGDYYLDKYGEEEGKKIIQELKEKYSFTKEKYIAKYGEERWKECARRKGEQSTYSGESINAFNILLEKLKNEFTVENVYMADTEFGLYDDKLKRYFSYDFRAKINGKSYIIEYDTPFMHPSKKYMSLEEYNNWHNVFAPNQTPEEKEQLDDRKKELAKIKGHIVFTFYVNENRSLEKNIEEFLELVSC